MKENLKLRRKGMLLVSILVILSAVPMDVLLPSYPSLAKFFGVDVHEIAFSITVFTVGFSFAQLLVGPISDRYGRKKCIVLGLLVSLIGTGGCIVSDRYSMFLIFRVFQSLGCACFVLAQAVVQDSFKGAAGIRARIYLTTLGGVAISCSPLLGTILENAVGWRGSFYLFSAFSVAALVCAVLFFEETVISSANTVGFYLRSYWKISKSLPFISFTLIGGLAFSCHFAFVIASPLLFMGEMNLGAYSYSWILMLYGGAYLFGGFCAGKIARKLTPILQIWSGLLLMTLSFLIMFISERVSGATATTVLLAMLVCTTGTSIVRPAAGTLAMDLFDELAGTAAAAGATIRFALGGILGAVVSTQGVLVSATLTWTILVSSSLSIAIFVFLQRKSEIGLLVSK